MQEENFNEELTSRKWKHRRQIAKISLVFAMVLVLLVIVVAVTGRAGDLSEFNSVLIIAISGFISLVGAYMGLATWKN